MRNRILVRRFPSGTVVKDKETGECGIVEYVDKNDMIRVKFGNEKRRVDNLSIEPMNSGGDKNG